MDCLLFLDFPVTIRDQIYAELLVPPVTKADNQTYTKEPLSTSILYTNKQIYAEASDILYTKNLFVVIMTNDPETFATLHRGHIPTIVQVKNSSKIAQCQRFAMTMEFLLSSHKLPSISTTFAVIPAWSLPHFASVLAMKNASWTAHFKVENCFRYTPSRISELLFGRFLSAEMLPKFAALSIGSPVDERYRNDMIRDCVNVNENSCTIIFMSIRACLDRVQFRMLHDDDSLDQGIRKEIPEAQIPEVPTLMLRLLDIFWDCHFRRARSLGHQCSVDVPYLFDEASCAYSLLAQAHCFAAARSSLKDINAYLEARRAAEAGIMYLKQRDPFEDAEYVPDDDANKKREHVNKAKARLSLRASEACIGLRDRVSATEYILDASKYNPDMKPTAREQIIHLGDYKWPENPQGAKVAILWGMPEVPVQWKDLVRGDKISKVTRELAHDRSESDNIDEDSTEMTRLSALRKRLLRMGS
ncbi:hypothetical protein K469DRAFT_252649 [Zopfia rhizophila CBS 207.26]|uniref:Uncharacterized protein n=1 Tax=Zopfia rhizophila CBS 207.26 TaxID=1314779 RepID=A0A6A6DT88_9PEZI|nr:hypothetical protein K469DRAFT_252649 [Zopfia rhizophila CBS 207.26]